MPTVGSKQRFLYGTEVSWKKGPQSPKTQASLRPGRPMHRAQAVCDLLAPLPSPRVSGEPWGPTQVLSDSALLGAANAISFALKSRPRRQSLEVVPEAVAGGATAPNVGAPTLCDRLDFMPRLSWLQVVLCLLISIAICGTAYAVTAPASISHWYMLRMAALAAVTLTAARSWLLERQYTARLLPPTDLGNADSLFRRLADVEVHYTLQAPPPAGEQGRATAVHCFHGFGANTASWAYFRQPLSAALGAQVTAHDMPGFGLTQRTRLPGSFTLGFNGRLGRTLMDAELAAAGIIPAIDVDAAAKEEVLESSMMFPARMSGGRTCADAAGAGQVRRVLIGHSMGAVCAVAEAIKHPEGIAALVLVAPALVAQPTEQGEAAGKPGHVTASNQSLSTAFAHGHLANPPAPPTRPGWMRRLLGLARALVWPLAFLWLRLVIFVTRPLLVLALRAAVRSRTFWLRGLASSWYNRHALPDELVDAYRAPQLVRGWEDGMLRFFLARVSGRGVLATFKETFTLQGIRQPATGHVRQLAALAAAHRLKVLIVHGENDRLLPLRNSRRLASLIPHCQLVTMPKCGHSPQEELPDQLVEHIQQFIKGTCA